MSRLKHTRRRAAGAALAAGAFALAVPATASAKINPATTIETATSGALDVGGAAMAGDGTGGVVYRKRVGGRAHIYVSRFDGTSWRASVRVDNGQNFDSSWPVIAAGRGGRLLVTWVQEGGESTDRMYGASLGPGASSFQDPLLIDLNVREASATHPSLAMNDSGAAYLVYRVVLSTSQSNPALPNDTVDGEVRIARTTGAVWSLIGQPLDRNPIAAQRTPNSGNGPKVAVDLNNNALVAWHEQDEFGVDRVFARRVFGESFGIPLAASPSSYNGRQLATGPDAFALSGAGFGTGAVAYRQLADPAAGLNAPRVFTNSIPDAFSAGAGAFLGARLADGGGVGGLSQPSVAVAPSGHLAAGFGSGGATFVADGDETAIGAPARVDDGASNIASDPSIQLGSDGSAAFASKALTSQGAGVAIVERRTDGVFSRALLSASGGGLARELKTGGSGLGDAIVAWQQGDPPNAQIAASIVDAPPQQFIASAPTTWQKKKFATITWERPNFALGSVSYGVTADDEEIATGLGSLSSQLKLSELDDGVLTVVVVARDSAGGETESVPTELKVDRHKPKIRVRGGRGKITITVSDSGSGIRKSATYIKQGKKKKKFSRRLTIKSSAGTRKITVWASDKAKHKRKITKKVTVK